MADYYTVREVALRLKVSPDTVRRRFADMPGVVSFTGPKRKHVTRRIPAEALNDFEGQNSRGFRLERKTRGGAI